jgi:hypothetical protein
MIKSLKIINKANAANIPKTIDKSFDIFGNFMVSGFLVGFKVREASQAYRLEFD